MRFSLRTLLLVSCFAVPLIYGLWNLSESLHGPFTGPVSWMSILSTDFAETKLVPR